MSEPIIIETPAPPTRERLVLVRERIIVPESRDATPADLERAGYVPSVGYLPRREVETAVSDAMDLQRRLDRMTEVAEQNLERFETAESELSAETIRADEWKAKCIEAEANLGAAESANAECHELIASETARAEKAERERDEARRLHSEAEAQVACRTELRAQVASLRAELARLTAPGEGEPTVSWFYDTYCARFESTQQEDCADAYRLGVAHERARHVEKDRATDEELGRVFGEAYTVEESPDHGVALRTAYLAVAAHVRQERCLIAQAVAADCDVHVTEQISGGWCVRVVAQTSSTAAGVSATVPRADAPSTLARLLGEVSRG